MELKPGKYRHFKGNEYELLFVAIHSETGEQMVVWFQFHIQPPKNAPGRFPAH